MSSRTSMVKRRRLAAELRRLREAAGLTIDQVAKALEVSSSKVSRIENEQVNATPRDVRDMLATYGVKGQQLDELVQLSREARQKGWWYRYRHLPDATLAGMEAAASRLRVWEIIGIPALFQSPEYARASLRSVRPRLNGEEIDRRVELRLTRQELLFGDNPPTLLAVVDEAALRRTVGGRDVMTTQLKRLSEAAELPTVTFQILPFTEGEQAGAEGPFTIISFPDKYDSDVVFAGNAADGTDSPNEVLRYEAIFDQLAAAALAPDRSIDFLTRILAQFP